MLNIQRYLANNDFSALYNELGIQSSVDNEVSPELVSLNYDMLASPKIHPIVAECRGLILSKTAPYQVIARTFDRFFNNDEALAITSEIDYTDVEALEKIDGSLVSIFYNPFDEQWNVATRKTVNGRKAITSKRISMIAIILEGMGIDVSDLDCFVPEGEDFLNKDVYSELIVRLNDAIASTGAFGVNYTYICEVAGPHNRVITEYKENKTYLLAIRHKETGEYLPLEHLDFIAHETELFSLPKRYAVKSKEQLALIVNELNQDTNALLEGIVVFDRNKNIFSKVKNNVYLIAHHRYSVKDGLVKLHEKDILDLVARKEEADFLSFYDYLKDDFAPYIENREKFIKELQEILNLVYREIENGISQKGIALMIKDPLIKNAIFLGIKKEITNASVLFSEIALKMRIKAISSN